MRHRFVEFALHERKIRESPFQRQPPVPVENHRFFIHALHHVEQMNACGAGVAEAKVRQAFQENSEALLRGKGRSAHGGPGQRLCENLRARFQHGVEVQRMELHPAAIQRQRVGTVLIAVGGIHRNRPVELLLCAAQIAQIQQCPGHAEIDHPGGARHVELGPVFVVVDEELVARDNGVLGLLIARGHHQHHGVFALRPGGRERIVAVAQGLERNFALPDVVGAPAAHPHFPDVSTDARARLLLQIGLLFAERQCFVDDAAAAKLIAPAIGVSEAQQCAALDVDQAELRGTPCQLLTGFPRAPVMRCGKDRRASLEEFSFRR